MKKLLIIGASGHGKVVADIAKKNKYENICFLDDNEQLQNCGNYPVVGRISSAIEYRQADFFVAVGDSKIREKIQRQLEDQDLNIVTLLHPNAIIGDDVLIGKGTVVVAGAVINSGTTIGQGCIINTSSSVDHDCIIGDFAHIAVGSHIAGTCSIGNNVWVGAGATIINNINILDDCIIGAGAVVVKHIDKKGTYVGVPARRMEK